MMVVKPKHVGEHFNVNFHVNFDILLEQSNFASVGYNKRLYGIKMHGTIAEKKVLREYLASTIRIKEILIIVIIVTAPLTFRHHASSI